MERKEALAAGLAKYDTGRPCKHGHKTYRYSLSGACADCLKIMISKKMPLPETTEIYLFSKKSGYDAVKLNIDSLILARYPGIDVDAVNPMPFKGKQVSRETYQIKVRVPPDDVDLAYEIGKLLLEPEL